MADVTPNFHIFVIFVVVNAGIIIDMKNVDKFIIHFGIKFIAPYYGVSLFLADKPETNENFHTAAILFSIFCGSTAVKRVANPVKMN